MKMHLGNLIKALAEEKKLTSKDIMLAFRCSKDKVNRMFQSHYLTTDMVMKWSLVLNHNLFEDLSCFFHQEKIKDIKE